VNTENSESHPFIAPDESYIIFDSSRPGGIGKGDLFICFRLANGSWSRAFNDTLLNTVESDWCPTVSPDGKYLFFTRNSTGNGDIYWVDAKIIEELKPDKL
jgi:Tol biopolymer transport system component